MPYVLTLLDLSILSLILDSLQLSLIVPVLHNFILLNLLSELSIIILFLFSGRLMIAGLLCHPRSTVINQHVVSILARVLFVLEKLPQI